MSTPPPDLHFIEELGMLFADQGAQPMMGRMLAHLLICDPPHQSSAELAEALQASAGSVSTITRQLLAMGMIQRAVVPGSRATSFRLTPGMWVDMMRSRNTGLRAVRLAAERGLEALSGRPAEQLDRLREFRDFYQFLEDEMPRMLDAWLARRSETER